MGIKAATPYRLYLLQAFILPVVILLTFCTPAIAQQPVADDTANTVKPYPDSITSFDQFELPPEMINEFLHLPVKDALLYHNEFQMLHDGVYGQAQVIIKVWYIDDHILGYIIETPFDHLNGAHVLKRKLNIPVTWCCMPAIEGHDQHCVATLADVRTMTVANKCTGWHIKLPDPYEPQISTKLQKRPNTQPVKGEFGHAEKTGTQPAKKKKGKKEPGFQQADDEKPAADSTGAKPVKDSIP